ncbi:MAG: hypothetical protein NUW01_05185, partial [Gemmatimonadaceae bacterium]|nr:hypothetical protein [Gemmatimonadaceae bacterium]
MRGFTDRRFGAFIDPDRVYVIEYRRVATGIAIVEHMSVERSMPTVEEAAEALVDLIRLSVAVPDEARVTDSRMRSTSASAASSTVGMLRSTLICSTIAI